MTEEVLDNEVIEQESESIPEKDLKAPALKIEVTQAVIDRAIQRSSSHCVIADAIKENVEWAQFVEVDIQTIRLSDREKKLRYYYLTPRVCQEVIVNFDQGNKIEPFTFKLKSAEAHVRISGNLTENVKEMKRAYNRKRKELLFQNTETHNTSSPSLVGGQAPPKVPNGQRRVTGVATRQ